MTEVAVEYLVARLEDWIFKETNKQRAAEETKLKAEFDRIKPFLKYADWKAIIMKNNIHESWVSDVIDLAREVENMIDNECRNIRVARDSVTSLMELLGESLNYFIGGKTKDSSHTSVASLHKRTTKKLKELEIRNDIPLFSSTEEARDERHMWHSKSFTREYPLTRMVGRDGEVKMLKGWLLKEDVDTPRLIAVTGITGIGKTAVATAVFECIKIYFDCAAWVFISGRPAIAILRDMFLGFSSTSFEMMDKKYSDDMDEQELTKIINNFLVGKKFLLVIDDLDTLDTWENLKCALPMKCRGNVLMTTHNSTFPAVMCKHVLHLEPLIPKDSLELLRRSACWWNNDLGEVIWPSSLELIVEKILEICEGHPLMVATVGGILSTMNVKEPMEWNKVLGMLKAAGECLPHFNMIQKVLVISYFNLPPMLKCCLLYCGIFPSHYEISCKRLIRIWVAEGFIERQLLGMTEEEIGTHLLNDLIRRNLLEVARVGTHGELITCRPMRLMHDFILETMNKDHFCIMSNKIQHSLLSDATRILVINDVINNFMLGVKTTSIRSLLLFRENGPWTPSILLNSLSNIKFLRVLELENSAIEALPEAFGDIALLRYVNLRGTRICNLPSSIKSLHELQTLDIRDTNVRAFPCSIDVLKMLRHLLLADSFSNRVVKLDGDIMFCKDLQTLAGIKLTPQIAFGLTYLPQLQKLSVGEVEGRGSLQLSKSLEQMKNLNSLTIKCAWRKEIQIQTSNPLENLEKLRVGGWIRNLLDWVCTLKSLKYLYLQDCILANDPFSSLQHLPSLTVLSLCNAYKGNKMCSDDAAGFPNLKELSLLNLEQLEEWTRIEEGSMRNLHKLSITKCPQLQLPLKGLENLTNLRVLQVVNMPADFIRKTRELSLQTGFHISVVC